MSTFSVKSKPVFVNRPSILPRKLHDCILLEICVFNNYTSADELFVKVLQELKIFPLVDNNLRQKIVLLVPTISYNNPRLLQWYLMLLILIYEVMNLISLHLHFDI